MYLIKKETLLFIIVITFALISCKTTDPCPKEPALGNIGETINTGNDDYLPVVYNDTLFFTTIVDSKAGDERIYKSIISDSGFSVPTLYTNLPYQNFNNISSPVFFDNPKTGYKELYFAATLKNDKKSNRDIYFSEFKNGNWEVPKSIAGGINSDSYESHPSLSPDGTLMLFSSDRKGGIGQTDIFISKRSLEANWSKPENLGKQINTPKMEISPYLDKQGNIWFASTGYSNKQKMDILKVEVDENGAWKKPKLLPFPINTDGDDTGPCVWNGKIILSSNRRGGCGGYDLYSFDICAPVVLEANVSSSNEDLNLNGSLRLYSDNNKLIDEIKLENERTGVFNIKAGMKYIVEYENECLINKKRRYSVSAPCSDTSVIKLVLPVIIDNHDNFTFSKYNIPFFVTGYYMPNTTENLTALKLKFTYNFFGNHDSTKYIENPREQYENIAPIVDKAFLEATNFIKDKINFLNSKCAKGNERIEIIVRGFTDPRQISADSKYAGEKIDDKNLKFKINPGELIDNKKLSSLRAYYTTMILQQNLQKHDEYTSFKDRVIWKIEGAGVDKSQIKNLELMRRADIEINIVD